MSNNTRNTLLPAQYGKPQQVSSVETMTGSQYKQNKQRSKKKKKPTKRLIDQCEILDTEEIHLNVHMKLPGEC